MREDAVATTTAWPRPRIEDEKFKLSEVRSTSPSVPRAGLTRAPLPPPGREGAYPQENKARAPGTNQHHKPVCRLESTLTRERVGWSPPLDL